LEKEKGKLEGKIEENEKKYEERMNYKENVIKEKDMIIYDYCRKPNIVINMITPKLYLNGLEGLKTLNYLDNYKYENNISQFAFNYNRNIIKRLNWKELFRLLFNNKEKRLLENSVIHDINRVIYESKINDMVIHSDEGFILSACLKLIEEIYNYGETILRKEGLWFNKSSIEDWKRMNSLRSFKIYHNKYFKSENAKDYLWCNIRNQIELEKKIIK